MNLNVYINTGETSHHVMSSIFQILYYHDVTFGFNYYKNKKTTHTFLECSFAFSQIQ